MAFTKVHQSILQSSLWCEDSDTKVVWITLLALADKHGEVAGSIPGLARTAGVPLERCQAAIAKFLSPDPFSRTPDNEGRRLEAIDGGWALVNYAKYRHEASKEDAKERNAKRQQRHRDKALLGVTRNGSSRSVTQNRDIAEAEAEADKDIGGKPPSTPDASSMPQACPKHEEAIYEAYPRKVARKNALKAIAKALKSVPHDVLLEKTKAYAASVVGKDPNYIPHPATWFNGERYLDGTETQGGTSKPESAEQPAKPMTERQKRIAEIRDKMENHPANPYVEFSHGARIPTQEERRDFRRLQSEIDRMLIGEAVAA